jgi:cytochrome c553
VEEHCAACHTLEGRTPDPTIPRNIGQSVFALYKQLPDFSSGSRVNETMSAARHNDIYHRMRSVAANLTSNEIRLLAIYYSGQ